MISTLIRLQREVDAAYRAIQICEDLSDEALREAAVLREQRS